MPPMPESLKNGRYVFERPIGDLALSEVYLGEDTHESRLIVVKLIRLDKNTFGKNTGQLRHLDKFKHEAGILVNLPHRHIVRIYDFGEEEQGNEILAYIVMHYYEEGSLQRWFTNRQRPLQVEEVAALLEQARDAVQYIHSRGLIHRDIKPHNFLVQSGQDPSALPTILLADFGLAQYVEGDMTQDSRGTAHYKAPEQWDKAPPIPATDQYALAIMAYYLLTYRYPFNGDTAQLQWDHQNTTPAAPSTYPDCPHIPSTIDTVILRALAKLPEERYDTVQDFTNAFRRACKLEPVPVVEPTPLSPTPPVVQIVSPPAWRQRKVFFVCLCGILLVLVLIPLVYSLVLYPSYAKETCNPVGVLKMRSVLFPTPLRAVRAPGDQCVGISDGSFTFDLKRYDRAIKEDAAKAFSERDIEVARSKWQEALKEDTNDAEAGIYLQNQLVRESRQPYITFIVVATLTGDDAAVKVGRDLLQGAYVAQREYNDSAHLPNQVQIILLIANVSWVSSACPDTCTNSVVDQIVKATEEDPSIKGIIGWPSVSEGRGSPALKKLANANLPVISTTSSDWWANIPSSFFHVAPTLRDQAYAAASYATSQWKVKTVALFYDPHNSYSFTLAKDFEQELKKAGGRVVYAGVYTVDHTEGLKDYLHAGLQVEPDLIYFAGYSKDVSNLVRQLKDLQYPGRVMGGDALYRPGGYSQDDLDGFDRLYFTASAFPDEWDGVPQVVENCKSGSFHPTFFCSYKDYFDYEVKHQDNPYGYIRQNGDVMLAYDAALTLFYASGQLLTEDKTDFKREGFPQILSQKIHDFQGVSGLIDFTPSTSKAVVVLQIQNGRNGFADSNPSQSIVGHFACGVDPAKKVGRTC